MSHKRYSVDFCEDSTGTKGKRNPNRPIFLTTSQERRFWTRVEKTNTCWLWTGSKKPSLNETHFYGVYSNLLAHRISYTLAYGQIPDDHAVDHLRESGICSSTLCVRPDHLEAVTHSENIKRYRRSLPRVCQRGHQMPPHGNCPECIRLKTAEWKERNREHLNASRRSWYAHNRDKVSEQRKARKHRRTEAA